MPEAILDSEEYIEQAYFFRVYRERLLENVPAQLILASVNEEILSTTKLPIAIEFLKGEILLNGRVSDGMLRLLHYFTAFQAFVFSMAEADRSRFDIRVALEILEREAEYRARQPTPAGMFVYQFESVSRNKLGYDRGMEAMSQDPIYDDRWRAWIMKARLQLGAVDFGDLIFHHSEQFLIERRRQTGEEDYEPPHPILFGAKEGKIAWANRGRDPLYMFAALQRQLGYPKVPRPRSLIGAEKDIPEMQSQIRQLEKRLQLLEAELKGNLDLSEFYARPADMQKDAEPETPS